MTQGRQRLHINERLVILVSVVAGAVATLGDASPTGDPLTDRILTGVIVAGLTWVAGAAQWWVLALAAGITAATANSYVLIACAAVPFALSMWIGTRQRSLSALRSLTAGIIVNLLLASELGGFFGSSAIVGIGVGAMVFASGMSRRSRRQRRWITITCATAAGVAVLSAGSLAVSAFTMRSTIIDAVDSVRAGVDQLSDGEVDAAANSLADAARELDRINNWIDAPWTQPSRLIPVIAQHRFAAVDLTAGAADLARVLSDELDVIDFGSLKPVDGRIDIDELQRVQEPAARLLRQVEAFSGTVDDARSAWLVPPLARELDDFDTELSRHVVSARKTQRAVEVAPAMLGADGVRRYFVAFTTPAEARGGGGFMGSWAEIEIDNGAITLTRTGRTGDLNEARQPGSTISGPEEFLDRYGKYGFTIGAGETTARDIWSTVNMSPHFPSTGDVIAQLYPQSGGSPIDGVFSLDVYALARFLEFTGPIAVEGVDTPLTADSIVEFLLFDQYRIDDGAIDRVDVLAAVAREVMTRLLDGALPEPQNLIRSMAPMVSEGRLVAYAVRPEEQDMFAAVNMTGALDNPDSGDVLAVAFNNATASKLELFLDATLSYDLAIDANGTAASTARIALTNSAPTTGWPSGVIDNYVGLPTGTNRLWVTVLSRLPVESATVDGTPVDVFASIEAGLFAYDWFIDIGPGETARLEVTCAGTVAIDPMVDDSNRVPLSVRLPPLVRPMPATITYTGPSGTTVTVSTSRPGTLRALSPTDLDS